jgi:crossover junction endodeoxyribonuclease RuvC
MTSDRFRILAVDPGTKEIGVAILEGSDLIYYGVKTIHNRSSALTILKQISSLTQSLVASYGPDYLAIEKTFLIQKSAALLNVAAGEIKSVARLCRLPVYEYSPSTVRKFICRNGHAKKREVAQIIAAQYPELSRHLRTLNKWDELYYANIFDAVAVGLTCLKELKLGSSGLEKLVHNEESSRSPA